MSALLPRRKSPRLVGYDYSQSRAYFVTICSFQRVHLFGEVHDGDMQLNQIGEVAARHWQMLSDHFSDIALDLWVVMPNHMHGIVVIERDDRDDSRSNKLTLGRVINTYKGSVTRSVRRTKRSDDLQIWQGRYHDHIIRDERGLNMLRQYVLYNPARWEKDTFYGE